MATINIDGLVNRWLINQFVSSTYNYGGTVYSVETHGSISDLSVITADADWECGCYSSWTRDDSFILRAKLMTKAGEIEFRYGVWGDFPAILGELAAEAFEKGIPDGCPYG